MNDSKLALKTKMIISYIILQRIVLTLLGIRSKKEQEEVVLINTKMCCFD